MELLISALALCISGFLLILRILDRRERRRGEIAKLRSDIILLLTAARHRVKSSLSHLNIIMVEVRRLPECVHKYEIIEEMPSILKDEKNIEERLANMVSDFGDMQISNRYEEGMLRRLQNLYQSLRLLEAEINKGEQQVLEMSERVRSILDMEKESEGMTLDRRRSK